MYTLFMTLPRDSLHHLFQKKRRRRRRREEEEEKRKRGRGKEVQERNLEIFYTTFHVTAFVPFLSLSLKGIPSIRFMHRLQYHSRKEREILSLMTSCLFFDFLEHFVAKDPCHQQQHLFRFIPDSALFLYTSHTSTARKRGKGREENGRKRDTKSLSPSLSHHVF